MCTWCMHGITLLEDATQCLVRVLTHLHTKCPHPCHIMFVASTLHCGSDELSFPRHTTAQCVAI